MDGENGVKDSHLALWMSLISCQCCWTRSDFCCGVCSLAKALGDDGGQLFLLQVSHAASENCRRGKKDILLWLIKQLESFWIPATGSHEWQYPNELFKLSGLRWTLLWVRRSHIKRYISHCATYLACVLGLCNREGVAPLFDRQLQWGMSTNSWYL